MNTINLLGDLSDINLVLQIYLVMYCKLDRLWKSIMLSAVTTVWEIILCVLESFVVSVFRDNSLDFAIPRLDNM